MIVRDQNILDEMTDSQGHKDPSKTKLVGKSGSSKSWYSIPDPIRRVFDQFPIITYKENTIPQRTTDNRKKHTLYVFANSFDASSSGMSCNPACLKWQAYLKFNDIEFMSIPSNNHASPSGSLPFLLPASSLEGSDPMPLTVGKLPQWTSRETMQEEDVLSLEHEAYIALVDQNIRSAWLYHLYLVKTNFENVACRLYVNSASSNTFVRLATARQLREAAQTELLKSRQIIDGEEIYIAAQKAFRALSTLLGQRLFFSYQDRPGLFDASVFAYTHLLLDQSLPWSNTDLTDLLQEHPLLIDHRQRLLELYRSS